MLNKIILISLIGGILLFACSKNNPFIDPPPTPIEARGVWQLSGNDSIKLAINILENEDSNRVFFCNLSQGSSGCNWGHLMSDNTIIFDNSALPKLNALKINNISLKLSSVDGSPNIFEGIYSSTSWIEGNCGFFSLSNNRIGFVEANCIIGNWYTLVPDVFGGPNKILYKNYNYNGTGELIIPEENKTITFNWNISSQLNNTLLNEYQFSDTSYVNVTYGFECTSTGLALGVKGKSWIRKSVVCY